MPTYKAEFLHHHYRSWKRWRPRHAYAFGFIDQAARLACRMPELANLATHLPVSRSLAKWAAGIDRHRPLPRFAPLTLQRWFAERGVTANPHGRPVVLFPDTFNNRLHTDVGVACVEAIEAAGWQVVRSSTYWRRCAGHDAQQDEQGEVDPRSSPGRRRTPAARSGRATTTCGLLEVARPASVHGCTEPVSRRT
ncbi:MAG: hypothetical protein ACR2K2_04965 [Mycobacteriales bacterium]